MKRLFLSAFLFNTGLTVTLVGVIFYLIVRFEATLFQLGLLSGVGAFVFMGAAWICGKFLSARYRAKPLTLLGASLFVIAFPIVPQIPVFSWIYLVYPVGAFGMGIFWPSLERWISSESEPGSLTRNMSLFNLSWGPGQIIAPFLAGVLFERQEHLAIWIGVLLTTSVLFLLPSIAEAKGTREPLDLKGPVEKLPPFLVVCWLGNFCAWFARSIFRSLFPKYGLSVGLTPSVIGAFLLLAGVGQLLFFFSLRRRSGNGARSPYPQGNADLLSRSYRSPTGPSRDRSAVHTWRFTFKRTRLVISFGSSVEEAGIQWILFS